jgi:hypothetical protein
MKKLIASFALLLSITFVGAQANDRPMHEIHSMLMFNFLKYIEWPADAIAERFVIAIVGDNDIYESINALYSNRKIAGKSVEIVQYKNASDIKSANMVYLASKYSNQFDDLKANFEGKPTLLVTDKNGLAKKGSSINFKVVGDKLKFEINEEAIANSKLKVASQLIAMGIAV